MPNRKIKHIVATLVGAQTEETLDVYDIDAVHKSDLTTSMNVTEEGYAADARALKTLNDKFSQYSRLSAGRSSVYPSEIYMKHLVTAKGEAFPAGTSSSSRGIRFWDNSVEDGGSGEMFSDAVARLGGLEHIINSDGASMINLLAFQNVAGSMNYAGLRAVIGQDASNCYLAFLSKTDGVNANIYEIFHAGTCPGLKTLYVSYTHNPDFSISNMHGYGMITDGGKMLRITVPYVTGLGSRPSIDDIGVNVFAYGGYPYARSGSTGQTYTKIGGEKVVVWQNGSTVRTNEVKSVAINVRNRSALDIAVNFTYPLCMDTNGTQVGTYLPVYTDVDATIHMYNPEST